MQNWSIISLTAQPGP